jgi:hypothetical protein
MCQSASIDAFKGIPGCFRVHYWTRSSLSIFNGAQRLWGPCLVISPFSDWTPGLKIHPVLNRLAGQPVVEVYDYRSLLYVHLFLFFVATLVCHSDAIRAVTYLVISNRRGLIFVLKTETCVHSFTHYICY